MSKEAVSHSTHIQIGTSSWSCFLAPNLSEAGNICRIWLLQDWVDPAVGSSCMWHMNAVWQFAIAVVNVAYCWVQWLRTIDMGRCLSQHASPVWWLLTIYCSGDAERGAPVFFPTIYGSSVQGQHLFSLQLRPLLLHNFCRWHMTKWRGRDAACAKVAWKWWFILEFNKQRQLIVKVSRKGTLEPVSGAACSVVFPISHFSILADGRQTLTALSSLCCNTLTIQIPVAVCLINWHVFCWVDHIEMHTSRVRAWWCSSAFQRSLSSLTLCWHQWCSHFLRDVSEHLLQHCTQTFPPELLRFFLTAITLLNLLR